MLIPEKHEKLKTNILVLGATILTILKKSGDINIEKGFQKIKLSTNIGLGQYLDTLTFLWLGGLIEIKQYKIYLK